MIADRRLLAEAKISHPAFLKAVVGKQRDHSARHECEQKGGWQVEREKGASRAQRSFRASPQRIKREAGLMPSRETRQISANALLA
jgi:hypothetical protein